MKTGRQRGSGPKGRGARRRRSRCLPRADPGKGGNMVSSHGDVSVLMITPRSADVEVEGATTTHPPPEGNGPEQAQQPRPRAAAPTGPMSTPATEVDPCRSHRLSRRAPGGADPAAGRDRVPGVSSLVGPEVTTRTRAWCARTRRRAGARLAIVIQVRPGTPADLHEVSTLVAQAFEADPLMVWLLPDAATRLEDTGRWWGRIVAGYLAAGRALISPIAATPACCGAPRLSSSLTCLGSHPFVR